MIRILCIGKMKDKALHMLEEEYTKRLKAFVKIEILEVRDEPNERIEREKEAALAKEKEGERALDQIRDGDFVILLDLHGSHWDSETFAAGARQCPMEALRPDIHSPDDARSGAGADLPRVYDH